MAAELHHGSPCMVDYTPTAAVAAGAMVVVGSAPATAGRVMVAHRDIAANDLGALASPSGQAVYKIAQNTAAGIAYEPGDPVWVDVSRGVGGEVTATTTASATIQLFGFAVATNGTGDDFVTASHY